jgi:hypothetical protein
MERWHLLVPGDTAHWRHTSDATIMAVSWLISTLQNAHSIIIERQYYLTLDGIELGFIDNGSPVPSLAYPPSWGFGAFPTCVRPCISRDSRQHYGSTLSMLPAGANRRGNAPVPVRLRHVDGHPCVPRLAWPFLKIRVSSSRCQCELDGTSPGRTLTVVPYCTK